MTPSRIPLAHRDAWLLAAVLAAAVLAIAGPPLAQPAAYHAFADHLPRWGVPHGFDVLSNLPFALAGAAGARHLLHGGARLDGLQRRLAWLACAGLLLTAAGSAAYHLRPDDAGLVLDRGAMVVAFAGLLGLAACRISPRAGAGLAVAVLVAGPLAIGAWFFTANLLPWAVLQAAGLLLLVAAAATTPAPGALPVRWGLVLAAYAVAKLLEAGDHAVWALTDGLVSGHTLKHLAAAAAAWPLVAALRTVCRAPQNA